MFVSSYSTYIDTATTKRVTQERKDVEKKPSDSFGSKLLETSAKDVSANQKLPINYISNYKSLHNKQQLQEKTLSQNANSAKFSKLNSMSSAKVAYTDNSQMFALIQKPKQTIDQTPKISRYLPEKTQAKQEGIMKINMVNTYIANDNYYQITSAA